MNRRKFFDLLVQSLAITGVSAITLAGLFPALFSKKRSIHKVVLGTEEELFSDNSYIIKHIDQQTFIIKKGKDGSIDAFDAACTHAGCPVQWNDSKKSFLCKCHGGVFDANGSPVSGPPKKPLNKVNLMKRNQTQEIILYLDKSHS